MRWHTIYPVIIFLLMTINEVLAMKLYVNVIVQNGMVKQIYSNDIDIEAEVIDLDSLDIEDILEKEQEIKNIEKTQYVVWE